MEQTGSKSFLESIVMLFISRVEITFAFTWTAVMGCIMAGKGLPPLMPTFVAIATSLFLSLAVYLYNDVVDREMDAASVNPKKQERPIAMGKVPVSHAMAFIYVCGTLGLFCAYMINQLAFVLSVVFLVTLTFYSYPPIRFKKMFIVKSVVTSIGPSWSLVIGGLAVSGAITAPLLFVSILEMMFVFMNLPALADSFDVKEDAQFGVKTLAMILSWKQKIQMTAAAVLIYFGATMLSYNYLSFNLVVPVAVTVFSVALLNHLRKLPESFDTGYASMTRKLAYAYYVLMPLFMAVGSLYLPFLVF